MTDTTPPKELAGRISPGVDWREIVAWVSDLPPIPHVAAQVIRVVEDPNCSAEDLSKVIKMDAALAARVLKIANSAMFSRQREITTINQAIMIIGFKALKGIAIAATLRQMASDASQIQKLVWENSICTAMCATTLAKKLRKSYIDEIFVLGLLHNLGQIVLLAKNESAKKYIEVVARIKEHGEDYVTAEQTVFGFSHGLIGALVAKKWNFSDETCQVILHYKDPIEAPLRTVIEEKTAIVQLGEALAHLVGSGNPEGYPDQRSEAVSLAALVGFSPETADADLTQLEDGIKEQFSSEKHVYD